MSTRSRGILGVGLLVALVLAGLVSFYASGSPDGLNRVAIDKGFDKGEKEHPLDEAPLAGYSVKSVDNERLSGGLAGVAGVAVTFLVVGGLAMAIRRRKAIAEPIDGAVEPIDNAAEQPGTGGLSGAGTELR